jgi:hypothetical protein
VQDFSAKPAPTPLTIPADIFKSLFGKEHPFQLTVHGANPQFTQAGYVFKADTAGYELSDPYYYNVPVYIDINSSGQYRLTSTAEGNYSVEVVVISKA